MKRHALAVIVLSAFLAPAGGVGASEEAAAIEVRSGTASFAVATNLLGMIVHGKSTALEARAVVRQDRDGIAVERIEAALPIMSLTTGLGLRDEHMRSYVFTTPDGQLPDVRFVGEQAACPGKSSRQITCEVSGELSIRGRSRPLVIVLKVTRDGALFHASGEATVKLSAYGIQRPSQLGVTTMDDVKLQLAFTAKPTPVSTTY